MLDLKRTIITADALNTQKTIAQKAEEKGAHYFFPVKGNHKGLLEDIELLFKAAQESDFKGVDADQYETLEKSRGRVEKRLYYSMDAELNIQTAYQIGIILFMLAAIVLETVDHFSQNRQG